ncbi:ETC complex I subunit [Ruegeria marisrubri]|nr:ETC complex I subunit [Ruegeria marisrubri]
MTGQHWHNRPPFDPRIPGTDLRGKEVPRVRIYRPAKSATQSAPRKRDWILEFEPCRARTLDPLVESTLGNDPFRQIRLTFPDRDSAIAYAENNDWRYDLRGDPPSERGLGSRRFWWEEVPAIKGSDAPGSWSIDTGRHPMSAHRLFRGVEASGSFDASDDARSGPRDPAPKTSLESFPASDAPAWTGTTLATGASKP